MSSPPSSRQSQRPSLAEVAARAGVSPATASRSLRGLAKVAPDTRERVSEAARQLNYGNAWRSAPGEGPHRTVAVIVPFVGRWYFGTLTAMVTDILRANGYDALLYHLGTVDVRDEFFAQVPLRGRVDGVATLSLPLTDEHTLSLRALGLPLVSIGSAMTGFPSVSIDDVDAARTATNHLINLGHRRIGFIGSKPDDPRFEFASSFSRRMGYEHALDGAGIAFHPSLVVAGAHGYEGGIAAMSELLGRPERPTAILAEFDELAIGALWALRRAGLRVPEDISVIGIDDHEMAALIDLTTIAQDVSRLSQEGARLLLRALATEPDDGAAEGHSAGSIIPTRLIVRGTTSPPHPDQLRGADTSS